MTYELNLSDHNITMIKEQTVILTTTITPAPYYFEIEFDFGEDPTLGAWWSGEGSDIEIYGDNTGNAILRVIAYIYDEHYDWIASASDTLYATVLTNVLPTPNKPTWIGETINWDKVDLATGYAVNFYINGEWGGYSSVDGADTVALDLTESLVMFFEYYPGASIQITIQAVGDGDPYMDGEESELSEPYVCQTLPQVKQPVWADYKLTWKDVENALSYIVRLYNNAGGVVATQTIAPGVRVADFSSELSAGTFTATVQASEVAISE